MDNKKFLQALGILTAIVLAVALPIILSRGKTSLSIEAQPTGIHIVAQNPMRGQRLGLSSPLEITFDRDMDSANGTFALLVDGKSVSGKGSWVNARTFTFVPAAPLQPATTYLATFSNLRAKDKTLLREKIEIEFKTVEALAVAQTFPAADTQEVDLTASVTVIFNHPVAPLSVGKGGALLRPYDAPLIFAPEVKGKGEWVNSSTYVFQPEKKLLSGTFYDVRIEAGLQDTLGNSLSASFNWQFRTRAPTIVSMGLKNGEQNPSAEVPNVPLDQVFIVTFGQPMNQQSVESATKIVNRETKAIVPATFTWDATFETLTITPKGKFNLASFYELDVDGSAQAADGGYIKQGYYWYAHFATVPQPSVTKVYPAALSSGVFSAGISITFASPMDAESLKGKVVISPPSQNPSDWVYNQYDKILYLGGLKPATNYVVRILPGMKDIYGNPILNETSYSFANGDYLPYARLVLPPTPLVYRAKGGAQEVYFEHLNLSDATVSVYPLTLSEFEKLSSGETAPTDFTPQVPSAREWQIGANPAKNNLQHELFQFADKSGKPLETGYYFVGARGKPLSYQTSFYQGFVFIVATDNITFKATSTEELAWVTDLESGAPQKDVAVTFYDGKFNELGNTTSDKDGLAYLHNGITPAAYASAEGGGHFAFTALNWGSGVNNGDFGVYSNYYGVSANLFAYLYTDRPVYRPDQEVFFKGILRQNDDLHYSLSTQKQVYVVVDQWGDKKIFSGYVLVNEQGSFTGKIKLAKEVSLGAYNISVYKSDAQSETIASISFDIAEYKKPEFEVRAASDKAAVLTGAKVNFGLDATYYSGGSLKGAAASWYVESANYYFTPASDKYSQFSFMDWDRDIFWSPQKDTFANALNESNGVTDANGHLDISQTFDVGKDKMSKTFTLYANVTDVAGNTVSGSASVVVHQSEIYAGIRSERYIGAAGVAQPFSVAVLDWASNPIAGQKVTVDFVERQWFSVQKKDARGQLTWETTVKEIPAGAQTVVTGADGIASVSFIPPKGGVYKAIVTVHDAKGNTQRASTYIWATSDQTIAWRQTNDRAFSLIADKEMYQVGDVAEILIAQPFENDVYALVTYERGHIYKQEVILLHGGSTIYKLPITDAMAPISYISVTVISGAEKTGSPNFKIGMTKINVDTKQKTIAVTVTADKKAAGPGDEITYTIETKDLSGKPVTADVSLAVVDKAVLALAPPNSAPMLDSFYSQQPLSVTTALGLVSNADEFNADYKKTIPDGSGNGGGGGGGESGVITVRQDFKDTAIFKAQVVTDANGTAQVKVKLPENLTTWSADARAVTADSRVGQSTSELVSTKPLFVQLQTPRFFVVGDAVTIGATIFNNSNQALSVNVALDAQGVKVKSNATQTITIAGKQQAYVAWDVVVDKDAARVDMTATATGRGAALLRPNDAPYTDASKPAVGTLSNQGIPVYRFTVAETVGTAGMVATADSATENIQLPTSLNFDNANLSVEVSPSLSASMTSGLTYLQDYPYLCMEQTISRFLPNVISSRALKAAGIDSPMQKDLDAQVNAALQKIYAKQLVDGGWNWWDGGVSDPQTSAYVVYGLIEAKDSGYPVTQTVLDNGVGYLKNNLPAELLTGVAASEYNRYAFTLYVLARANELDAGLTNFIFENRALLDNYGKAYLAQALHMLDPKDSRIDTLMSDLASASVQSAAGIHWEEKTQDYWNWNSDTRSTAIVLNAFVQIDPQNKLNANVVRWLMAHRNGGHWYSTQETTWSLIALTNWMIASKEYETNYQYAIGLNGKMLKEGQASKDNLNETVKLQLQLKDMLKDVSNSLVFARGSGAGNLYYAAYLTASLPVDKIQPLDQGMSLSREYFTLTDSKTPITEIKRGELVKVRLTVVVPDAVHYVVIDDPLPAGMEAVDQSLLTDTAVPSVYTAQDYNERGWGWWYFSHVELRDNKVTLSTDYLPAGTYVYTYIARASSAGTFNVIPPTAFEFYFPDVAGRGAGSVFTVK